MDELTLAVRREQALSALWPLFFVSGATSLTYQTLWGRELHLVFGTSTFAIATVLSAFMAGLAVGGFVMARYADRLRKPLQVYGVLEAGIGVYALVFPFIVTALEPVYLGVWRAAEPGPVAFGVVQFLLVGSALLLPTAAMGATLPLLARFATDSMGSAGDRVGRLYAVNTAGAVFGTWLCGFVLLPWIGLWTTTVLAALANIALGALALGVQTYAGEESERVLTNDLSPASRLTGVGPAVAVTLGLAGFASLVYEVAWFRVLSLMLGPSVYAFSLMLLAFLIGIALGGGLGGRLADRVMAERGVSGVLLTLAAVEAGVALLSWIAMYGFQFMPWLYVQLFDWFDGARYPAGLWVASLLLAGLIMTPPAVLMGAAFPLAVRAVVVDAAELGAPVGRIYGANTLGSVVGASLAGFVLLPTLGVQGAIFFAASANLAAAALVAWRSRVGQRAALVVGLPVAALVLGGTVAAPPWNKLLMTAGMYKYVSDLDDHSWSGVMDFAVNRYDLLFYEEGLTSVVTVARNSTSGSGNIWLANNGKIDASTSTDMPTQVMCALLAFQFVEDPEDVLVIGLASGITAGAVTTVPAVERLDVVEIEPAIIEASRLFEEHNHHVLDDPRTNMIANDGRNHVLLAAPETYDVVVSEPSNPWITGVSNLFTREFFELGRTRLKPGGVWSQWVQLYGMDDHDVRSLLATFADVYPYVLVYTTIEDADLVLLGSDSPIAPDAQRARAMLDRWPTVADEFRSVEVRDELDLMALFYMDRDGVLDMANNIQLNTDDNMRIEYRAPLHLHSSTAFENFLTMSPHASIPADDLSADQLVELGERYRARDDTSRAVLSVAIGASRYPSGSGARSTLLDLAEQWTRESQEVEDPDETDATPEEAGSSESPGEQPPSNDGE